MRRLFVNALELHNVTKRFGEKVIANDHVSLTVRRGEILAVLGENGSGKTTLMNMIAGIYHPDEGEIYVNGQPVTISSPRDAFRCGIGMVHQHFKLVDVFTATENIVLGVEDGKPYRLKEATRRVEEISARYGFEIDAKKKIYAMSVSEKQTVEIVKVLYRGAEILILDEPTAVLTPQETEKLFAVLRRMREDGKSIVIITHKLNEVLSLSDRVTVLHKGKNAGTVNTAETNEAQLTEMMVGQKVVLNIERKMPENPEDRLVVKDGIRQRLTDSIETALKLSKGVVVADFVDLDEKDPDRRKPFSEKRACPNGHQLELDEIEPRTFSFNAPYGACPECTGIGYKLEIDPELVIPDPDKTLNENAIEPWGMTKGTGEYYRHVLEGLGDEMGFDLDTPWKDLPKDARDAIMYGRDFKVQVSYRNRWGRMREYSTGFEGVVRTLMRRHDETDSDQMKQYYESYMREVPCQACHGRRLRPEVLAVTVGDESIADVCDMSAERSLAWINGLELEGSAAQIAGEVVKEIRARLGFLNDVGLNYLTLSRAAKTLSGGEAQRIRLATQIGSGLVGVMYVLDEPSIGLHQRDNERLIGTLHHLRDLGNTLIVVEHDEDTIRNADWVIDIGPGAGEHGGEVVYSGPARKITEAPRSITGADLPPRATPPPADGRSKCPPHAARRIRPSSCAWSEPARTTSRT